MYALGGALANSTSWSLVCALKKKEFRIREFTAYLPLAVALSYSHY
jgi:hypothetical protein